MVPATIQKQGWLITSASMATAAALAVTSHGSEGTWDVSASEHLTPEEQLAQAELFELIRRNIDDLGPDEAGVIRAYYFEGKSFNDLAEELNFSKSWACRLHTQGMQRLTRRIKSLI